MPITCKRNVEEVTNTDGFTYNLPYYTIFVFKKEIPCLLFYLAHGIDYTLSFLNVEDVISFVEKAPADWEDEYMYFNISNSLFLKVDRELFDKYPYIKSVVGGFLHICSNRTTMAKLDNTREWIKKIADPANYEKGLIVLKYFNRLLDETTKKVLRIPEYHKKDIYSLLRWLMQEYNYLRMKDNCDLGNKRLRCNEYIASLLTKTFSKRLKNRIINNGNKVTIDNIRELFKFSGDREYVS